LVGERSLLEEHAIEVPPSPQGQGKPVHVAVDGAFAGTLLLKENLRPEAGTTLGILADLGCRCRILSGDPAPVHSRIGGVEVEGGLSPQAKADRVQSWKKDGARILFVGDGINDLPAMQACDSALAVDLGAALATEFADGLLVEGRVAALPGAIHHARRLRRSLHGNLRFALAYNMIGMALAAAGLLHPVVAAFLMVGSSAVVSYRALRVAAVSG
jgi:P-type E1-E2 ATPase